MGETKASWRRGTSSGCVGGDCDTVYPRTEHNGRTGHIAILEVVSSDGLEYQPAPHETAVFIPDDVLGHLG